LQPGFLGDKRSLLYHPFQRNHGQDHEDDQHDHGNQGKA
jgi:hypothetical protein